MSFNAILKEATTPHKGENSQKCNSVVAGYTTKTATEHIAAVGVEDVDTGKPVTIDTVYAFYSLTKALTTFAALKLWEDGKLDFDVPAKTYLPLIGDILLVERDEIDVETGEFLTPPRKPKTEVTVRHLLLQTAGFAYAGMDPGYTALLKKAKVNPFKVDYFKTATTPILFEPGTEWNYGQNTDLVGLVVGAVSGKTLGAYLKEKLFDPAGMTTCTFDPPADNQSKLHLYRKGKLSVSKKGLSDYERDYDQGGAGCYGTAPDYLRFLRVLLNYGYSPDTGARILKPETVKYAVQDHLPKDTNALIPGWGAPGGFTLLSSYYAQEPMETGRSQGSIHWMGLANLFWFVDFEKGLAAVWMSSVLPPLNYNIMTSYLEFEAEVVKIADKANARKSHL